MSDPQIPIEVRVDENAPSGNLIYVLARLLLSIANRELKDKREKEETEKAARVASETAQAKLRREEEKERAQKESESISQTIIGEVQQELAALKQTQAPETP